MNQTSTPEPRNKKTFSLCVATVSTRLTAKMAHSNLSLPMFLAVSFHALMAMMPMTAAPTP